MSFSHWLNYCNEIPFVFCYVRSLMYVKLQGTLFHLPQFFVERRSKAQVLIHRLVVFLKDRGPNFMAPIDEVKEMLNLGNSFKKLMKHSDFQRLMSVDLRVPYRQLFPDAPESKWREPPPRSPGKLRQAKEDITPPREKMVLSNSKIYIYSIFPL